MFSAHRGDEQPAPLAALAPGTELRDGLERILRGRTGALIVLGHDRTVDHIATGVSRSTSGSPLRGCVAAKMDGAIVVDKDITRIVRAALARSPTPRSRPPNPAPATERPSGSPNSRFPSSASAR